jgi:hypothetical protein
MAGGCCWHAAAARPLQPLLQGSCHLLRGDVGASLVVRLPAAWPARRRAQSVLLCVRLAGSSCHISLPLEWWPATASPTLYCGWDLAASFFVERKQHSALFHVSALCSTAGWLGRVTRTGPVQRPHCSTHAAGGQMRADCSGIGR